MSMLDTYRNNLLRKREEAAKLNQDLAKEQAKIAPLQQKIISANAAIGRTKSASTIKSKLNEIERANKAIADTQKKVGDIQKKLAQKEKEIAAAEKTYHNEETKVNKKAADAEKKRIQEASRQSAALEQAIHRQEQLQFQMRQEIDEMKALPEKITVLFLAANPKSTPQLNLDEEARAIREKIRLSEYRDSVQFESRWAVRAGDILQAINETNPTIVHVFSFFVRIRGLEQHGPAQQGKQQPSGLLLSARFPTRRNVYRGCWGNIAIVLRFVFLVVEN